MILAGLLFAPVVQAQPVWFAEVAKKMPDDIGMTTVGDMCFAGSASKSIMAIGKKTTAKPCTEGKASTFPESYIVQKTTGVAYVADITKYQNDLRHVIFPDGYHGAARKSEAGTSAGFTGGYIMQGIWADSTKKTIWVGEAHAAVTAGVLKTKTNTFLVSTDKKEKKICITTVSADGKDCDGPDREFKAGDYKFALYGYNSVDYTYQAKNWFSEATDWKYIGFRQEIVPKGITKFKMTARDGTTYTHDTVDTGRGKDIKSMDFEGADGTKMHYEFPTDYNHGSYETSGKLNYKKSGSVKVCIGRNYKASYLAGVKALLVAGKGAANGPIADDKFMSIGEGGITIDYLVPLTDNLKTKTGFFAYDPTVTVVPAAKATTAATTTAAKATATTTKAAAVTATKASATTKAAAATATKAAATTKAAAATATKAAAATTAAKAAAAPFATGIADFTATEVLPVGVTGAKLMASTAYKNAKIAALADVLKVTKDKVEIVGFTVSTARQLASDAADRRLAAHLGSKAVKTDFKVTAADEVAAAAMKKVFADKAAFKTSMKTALDTAFAAADFSGDTVITAKPTVSAVSAVSDPTVTVLAPAATTTAAASGAATISGLSSLVLAVVAYSFL